MNRTYPELYVEAEQNTRSLGKTVPRLAPVSGWRITEEHGMELMARLGGFNPDLRQPSAFAFQCAGRNRELRPLIEDIIGMKCALTIGDVRWEEKRLWTFDLENFPEMGRSGNYHVWLTAANGEIVDLTVLVSIAALRGTPLDSAVPVAGLPAELSPLSWRPVLVGDDAVGALLEDWSQQF